MNWKGGLLFLALAAGGSWALQPAVPAFDLQGEIAESVEEEAWEDVLARLEPELRGGLEEHWALEAYGRALAALERPDEAAYYLGRAVDAFDRSGAKSTRDSRKNERALYDLDPLAKARVSYFNRIRKLYLDCVDKLLEDEHKGLAQDLLEDLCQVMGDASICGLGQAAPNPIRLVMKHFADEI